MLKIRQLLNEESQYKLCPEIMDQFLNKCDLIQFKRGQIIIDEGDVNKDVYILKEGIVAYTYLNGCDERCYAFALPATIIYSTASFYLGQQSFYRISACTPTELLHISKGDFDDLIASSHEFARFILSTTVNQLYLLERKNILINGTTAERFRQLVKNRPEIVKYVTSKLIASYLGITQQHLCRLKKQLIK